MYSTVKLSFKEMSQKPAHFWLLLGLFWKRAHIMQLIVLSFYPKVLDFWLDKSQLYHWFHRCDLEQVSGFFAFFFIQSNKIV